ncbi:MAG: AzlD domain-containing protein [Chloroflexi bacterium]|nr:AzlD domain-containing protein [Chloroflexota bacterium]MBP7042470.1 AzlD domain-containing protein [Chloroflexota bacterium]
MNIWIAIIGMGIITYALRLGPILLMERIEISGTARQALRFVPAAVLSAIIFPELLMPGGALDISLGNERLLAGLLAAVVAWRTKNVLWTIAMGMAALWLLQAVG